MPVALPIIVAAVAIAGAGVSAYSSIQSGKAAEESGKYNAAVERNNAKMAQDRANYEADRLRKRNMLIRGKQRAAFAKSGVEISGSADDVIFDTELEGALDIQAAKYAGRAAATAHAARARLDLFEGANAKRAGMFNAGATILGGLSDAAVGYTSTRSGLRARGDDPTV